MTFDIQEHARSAQAAYQDALARLNTARTAYETGGGAAYAAAKAQRELLERKIKEADDEVRTANDAYHQAWVADNFEKTDRVREVLARKHESEATCEALRVALARSEQDMQRHLLDASVQGREYDAAHGSAYAAYVRAEAYTALAQSGEAIARALALSVNVRSAGGYYDSDIGMPLGTLPADLIDKAIKGRQAYIHAALVAMASRHETHVDVPEIGACDFGALQVRELLSPVQIHKVRRSGEAVL